MSGPSFKTRAGGDPAEYVLRLAAASLVTIGDVSEAGQALRTRILQRTAKGIDASGAGFAPYSESYRRQKTRELGSASPVNLFGFAHSDHVLLSMALRVNGEVIDAGVVNDGTGRLLELGWFSGAPDTRTLRQRIRAYKKGPKKLSKKARKAANAAGSSVAQRAEWNNEGTPRAPARNFASASSDDVALMNFIINKRRQERVAAVK